MATPLEFRAANVISRGALLIAGPTAVGKSEIALHLAQELGGEILSVDSMQVYRGLDIGTAKPTAQQRADTPHHLIDIVPITESFDVARYVQLARQAIIDIQSRGRLPVLCGGTGLYFKALLEGLGNAPPANAELRTQLEGTPLPDLLGELARHDSVTYNRIDHQNRRRVMRAVEVIRLTGKAFSLQRADWQQTSKEPWNRPNFVGLRRSPGDLHLRIDVRVEAMFRAGLVAETEALLQRGLAENRTAMQALGYRQVTEFLRGERSLSDTIELVKTRTRQFAKRQMTWFRKQADLDWVPLGPDLAANLDQVRLVAANAQKNQLCSGPKDAIVS